MKAYVSKQFKIKYEFYEKMLRGHTLITLAHKGTYLVCKMLTTVLKELSGTVIKMLTMVLSWSDIDKNVLT